MTSFSNFSWPANILGLMSGTSGDGIEGALVHFEKNGDFSLLWHDSWSFPQPWKDRLQKLMGGCSGEEVARAGSFIAELYSMAVKTFVSRHAEPVHFLAAHGQTLAHEPALTDWDGIMTSGTLQALNAGWLAEKTGIAVLHDFRTRDMAVGGQGAPLVPFGDLRFFGQIPGDSVALNIGGIANVTVMRQQQPSDVTPRNEMGTSQANKEPAGSGDKTGNTLGNSAGSVEAQRGNQNAGNPFVSLAFDTGPGNMLMDALAVKISQGKSSFDLNGAIAARGKTDPVLLKELLGDPYFSLQPPKSTGRDRFGTKRFEEIYSRVGGSISSENLMSTFLDFTIESIIDSLAKFVIPKGKIDLLIVAGGGAKNRELMNRLRVRMEKISPVTPSDAWGVPPEAREAMAFAALGEAFLRMIPAGIPAATGAKIPVILGSFTPGKTN